jgi:hypothetical protein
MADGYVLLEFNTVGEARVSTLECFDFRLADSLDFDAIEGIEQIKEQLPEVKGALVMVVFDYKFTKSTSYWGIDDDGEEEIIVVSHTVVNNNYKEFSREMLTYLTEDRLHSIYAQGDPRDPDTMAIAEWEEFYDEEFKPFKKESKKLTMRDVFNRAHEEEEL